MQNRQKNWHALPVFLKRRVIVEERGVLDKIRSLNVAIIGRFMTFGRDFLIQRLLKSGNC